MRKCQLSKQFSLTLWMSHKMTFSVGWKRITRQRDVERALWVIKFLFIECFSILFSFFFLQNFQSSLSWPGPTFQVFFPSNFTHLAAAGMSWHCYVEIKSSKLTSITKIIQCRMLTVWHCVRRSEEQIRCDENTLKSFLMLIVKWNYEAADEMLLFFHFQLRVWIGNFMRDDEMMMWRQWRSTNNVDMLWCAQLLTTQPTTM